MGINLEFESPFVNAACALLLLSVERGEAVAEAEAEGFTLTRLELILKTTFKTTIMN
jgi:hypothetical protein